MIWNPPPPPPSITASCMHPPLLECHIKTSEMKLKLVHPVFTYVTVFVNIERGMSLWLGNDRMTDKLTRVCCSVVSVTAQTAYDSLTLFRMLYAVGVYHVPYTVGKFCDTPMHDGWLCC